LLRNATANHGLVRLRSGQAHQPGDEGEKEVRGRGAGGKGEDPLRTAPFSEAPLPLVSTVNPPGMPSLREAAPTARQGRTAVRTRREPPLLRNATAKAQPLSTTRQGRT
jgi:hypothetical protein